MLLWCIFSAWITEPIHKVRLDMAGESGFDIQIFDMSLEKDGSFLGVSMHQVWHWDSSGQLIQKFGGEGDGPGEFSLISEALWDGEHYWIIDGRKRESSVFDPAGNHLFSQPLYFRQLIRVGDHLFTLDHSKIRLDPVTYPPVIQRINYEISENQIKIAKIGKPFMKVTKRQMDFYFNFKLLWLAFDSEKVLVVDQLEPKMRVYSQITREKEKRVPISDTFSPNSIPIQAPRWEEPPSNVKRRRHTRESALRWINSFSKINYFGRLGNQDQYIIAYLIPNPEDDLESLQVIQLVDASGQIVGPVFEGGGKIVGSKNRQVFVYDELELDEETEHVLTIYQF